MEFYIYGEITDETLQEIKMFLDAAGKKPVTVRISSGGGDIFPALAIYNLLKSQGNVTVVIDGLCASAASIAALGGVKICAAANSLCMFHNPAVLLIDFYSLPELDKVRNALTAIEGAIIDTYKTRLAKSTEELQQIMAAETWLNAEQAKEIGFIDEIVASTSIKNFGGLKMNNEILNEKYKASVLAAERGRITALNALKCENAAVNALIDKAVELGAEVETIKPYIDAVKAVSNVFAAQVADNLSSGAANVEGAAVRNTVADSVSKYLNTMLKAGSK